MTKLFTAILFLFSALSLYSQTAQPTPDPDKLDGSYGRHRANNDLVYYHLDVRVDPEKKWIGGKNTIRVQDAQG